MTIVELFIKKLSHQLAYDEKFLSMSKHNGRLRLLLKEVIRKNKEIPLEVKERLLNCYSEAIMKNARDIFLDETINKCINVERDKKSSYLG